MMMIGNILIFHCVCNISLGLCALFKVQIVLHCKVKLALSPFCNYKKIGKSQENIQNLVISFQ